MKLLRSFPALAFSLVLLSIAGLCAAQQSVGLLLVAGTLAAISWYVTEGPRGRTLPHWVSNILVIAVCLNVVVDLVQHQDNVLGVLGRFAVWLTLIKLYERRASRDYAHLLTLSLLLMLTGCLQSNGLLFGIILLLYAVLGLYVLLLHQVYGAFERAGNLRQAAIPGGYRLVPPMKPITGRHPGLRFRTQALAIGVAGVLLSLAVFLAFPRDLGAGMLGAARLPTLARKTQFAWNVDLTVGGRITDSRVKVLDLELTDHQGRPVRRDQPLLLRGAVLDEYQGHGRWSGRPGSMARVPLDAAGMTPLGDSAVAESAQTLTQRFILNCPAEGVNPIFSIYAPISVAITGDAALIYNRAAQTIMADETSRRLLGYTVQAQASPSDAALEGLTNASRAHVESKPPWFNEADDKTLRAVADARLKASGLPTKPPPILADLYQWNHDAAAAFTEYLHSAEFSYTTDLGGVVYSGADVDPIVRFLTGAKRGHCEFFASGLAALCHVKGIPARLVVGYVAYEFDETARQYNVLESNAHAWGEVLTEERRWTTFDPTPPATLISLHSARGTIADQVRWVYQRFEGNWSSTIVSFDGTSQSQLAQMLNRTWSSRFTNALEAIRAWMERVNQAFYFGPAGYIWMGIVVLVLAIAVVALVKLMRRSMAVRRTLQLQHLRGREYQRMLRQLGFYLDMLSVLKRGGWSKPLWQPPLAFAQALQSRHAGAADLVRRITEVFYEARYGRGRMDAQQLGQVRTLVSDLAATLGVKKW